MLFKNNLYTEICDDPEDIEEVAAFLEEAGVQKCSRGRAG